MKKSIFNRLGVFALSLLALSSCHNGESNFDDFDYTAVYFAYQSPVRTIVLGEDVYDTTLDNEHKFRVFAVMGGCYANTEQVAIDVEAAGDLCEDLYFEDGTPVKPLPANYYTLSSDQIILDKSLNGGVEVQLSEEFFADPLSITNCYVLPLRMTNVTNADKILSGEAVVDDPCVYNAADWKVMPKDYTLYCVKYINKWDANYLRRGVDDITIAGETTKVTREEKFVEDDQVCELSTKSYTDVIFPVTILDAADQKVTCDLILSFDGDKCTVSTESDNFTASGSGEFKVDGEKQSWGNKDRDAIYLDYEISYNTGEVVYKTTDTLVVRDRGVSIETFTPDYKPTI